MSYTYASGTSMAAPHVAGVAAVYLQEHPNASPQEVSAAITGGATQGAIDTGGFKQGTTNRLLFSRLSGPGGVMASNGP
jgi:subtilisin family serine protease